MNFPSLFSPLTIRGMTVKNRLVMAPMESHLCHADGSVSRESIAYYRERALGGVGLIHVEFTCVDSMDGHSGAVPQLRLDSNFYRSGHARLAEAIQSAGSLACIQLSHAGRQAPSTSIGGRSSIGPSAVPSPYYRTVPRAMDESDIQRMIERFADAAGRAVAAGYDAILLHGSHGYLLSEFLSPLANHRDDAWGGDLERRMRFPVEVIKAVRSVIGATPLMYRLGVSDFVEGGVTLEDSEIVAPHLCAAGVDALDISISSPARLDLIVEPMSVDEGWRLPLARRIRAASGVPVACAGQIRWPEMADRAIADGDVDMVSLGRPLLADAQWPNKAKAGRVSSIRPCTSCNWCLIQTTQRQLAVSCAENPRCGNELDPPLGSFGKGQPAVVIGGGPGGMTAALLLDQAGFKVELYERRVSLGGGLTTSAAPPSKDKLLWYQTYLLEQMALSNVRLRLGETASAAALAAANPAIVIAATGSRPAPLSGISLGDLRVESATGVLLGDIEIAAPDASRPVVIYGGGETGVESAEYLAQRGHHVVLVSRSAADKLARNAERLYRITMLRRVTQNPNIEIAALTSLAGTGADYVTLRNAEGVERQQPACMLLLAHGFVPDTSLTDELAAQGIMAMTIGDAHRVARIGEAVRQAYRSVMDLRYGSPQASALAC